MDFSWMAWTKPTAYFFLTILCFLITLTVWEIKVPGGNPRNSVLGFETTRGDRLFMSLLGSAYIHIFWIALTSARDAVIIASSTATLYPLSSELPPR